MARRNETLLEILCSSPWWVSVVVAGLAYVGLQFIVPAIELQGPLFMHLTKIGPVFAPWAALLLLLPAPFTYLNARRKKKLLDQQQDLASIRALSWKQFEELVGEAFRRQGYSVSENDGAGPDGGVDLWLRKSGQRYLVQCKNWRSQKVGVKVVREMYGLITAHQATGAMLVTSGMFTQEAKNFARDKPLDLIEGQQLSALIDIVKTGGNQHRQTTAASPDLDAPSTPLCPSCGAVMVLRIARKGTQAGKQFWGCSRYPACRGTRSAVLANTPFPVDA